MYGKTQRTTHLDPVPKRTISPSSSAGSSSSGHNFCETSFKILSLRVGNVDFHFPKRGLFALNTQTFEPSNRPAFDERRVASCSLRGSATERLSVKERPCCLIFEESASDAARKQHCWLSDACRDDNSVASSLCRIKPSEWCAV